ncbi:lipoprotein LpqH [Mycobacterium sp. OAS707]|uniref:lipoprotein LpqH n=1 Tax=Mycobacterium sp. OAS707 TaxID=2663822 RepID=UPI00178B2694
MVKIRDVEGFTGDYWRGGVGQAEAGRSGPQLIVSGSAYCVTDHGRPTPTTTAFRLVAVC